MLVILMTLSVFASCSKEEAPETTAQPAQTEAAEAPVAEESEPVVEETEAPAEETEAPAAEAEAEEPAEDSTSFEDILASVLADKEVGYPIEEMDLWHYRCFNVTYHDDDYGKYYDPDEMAEFIEKNPEWYKDTDMMEKWEEAEGPFGDYANESLAAETEWLLDKENYQGIMFYKTFEIENLGDDALYDFHIFYDNTPYIYNGEPYYILDGNFETQDWNHGYDALNYSNQSDKTFKDFLHEGTNYIAVSMKDAWGNREFDCYLYYERTTRKSVEFLHESDEWQYTTFYAPYIDGDGVEEGEAPGGHYEPDEMADYIAAHPDFMSDKETASQWPTTRAPLKNNADWTGANHGLMLYKAFNVSSAEEFQSADQFILYGDYDNTIYVYLNGVLIYSEDGELVSQDWRSSITIELDKDLILNTLVDGENFVIITLKDAWGARDFNMKMSAEWN